jgi:hypothetical protein
VTNRLKMANGFSPFKQPLSTTCNHISIENYKKVVVDSGLLWYHKWKKKLISSKSNLEKVAVSW